MKYGSSPGELGTQSKTLNTHQNINTSLRKWGTPENVIIPARNKKPNIKYYFPVCHPWCRTRATTDRYETNLWESESQTGLLNPEFRSHGLKYR